MTEFQQGFVEGKMFLYERPEVLSREAHEGLGIKAIDAPFAFCRATRALPLTVTEFTTAQKDYPVVFASVERPVPLVIVGISEDRNLFVGDDGQWEEGRYVPAYLRCYPFAFARKGDDQIAVVIDRAAAQVSDQPDYPFFDEEELSEHTQHMTQFCGTYHGERNRTEAFGRQLAELGLLTTQHVSHTPDGESEPKVLASYVSVDAEKLEGLDKDVVFDLHRSGKLAAIYAQLNSLDNWSRLLARHLVAVG